MSECVCVRVCVCVYILSMFLAFISWKKIVLKVIPMKSSSCVIIVIVVFTILLS